MALSFLLLMVHLLMGGCFGFFLQRLSIIYISYISQGQILHRTCVCMKSCLFEGLIQGYKEATFLVLQILHLEPSPKSTLQALPPPQIKKNNKQYWLSSFRAQIINPAGENLGRALSGGKRRYPSVSFSTKLMLVPNFSAKAHLVHVCWAQHIHYGDPKEA